MQRQYLGLRSGTCRPTSALPIWLDYDEHAPDARALLQELQVAHSAAGLAAAEIIEGGLSSAGNVAR